VRGRSAARIKHWKVNELPTARNARNWLVLIVFVGIVAVMDYLLLNYLTSHGLQAKSYPIFVGNNQLSIPLLSLTFAGVIIVAIAAWHYMSSTMPISALKEMSQLETIRMLRAAGVALFFFSAVVFGPYIVGASAFWTQMSSLGQAVPQLAGPIQGLFSSIQPAMNSDALTKLAISQNIAAAALVAVSGLIGSLQRRTRRVR
jgi:hypothetical protein